MRTKAVLSVAVLAVCSFALPALAVKNISFPVYFLGNGFSTSTVDKNSGLEIERAVYSTAKRTFSGKSFIVAVVDNTRTEKGRAIKEKIDRYYTLSGDKISTYNITMVSTAEGRTYQYSRRSYDWGDGTISVEFADYLTGKQVLKTVPLSGSIVDYQDLTFYMYDMVVNSAKKRNITLMFPDGGTVPIALSSDYSVQQISLGNKTVNCYRIGLKPDFGLLSSLIPDSGYWFEAAPPYRFIKYEGTLKGPGSPDVIISESKP